MMSTEQIAELADEAAERAALEGLQPYVPWDAEEVRRWGADRPIPIPNLGSLRPEGWKLEEHRMADKTGWGDESEPAMTVGQLQDWVIEHMGTSQGYAIIEEGQFQVVIGRFANLKIHPDA